MKYIDVTWNHSDENYPARLVSELGSERNELRKLEFFKDGQVGYASDDKNHLSTRLGESPIPSLEEINANGEFVGKYISGEEFEALWNRHVQ